MKKRILAAVLATASILGTVAGCQSTPATSTTDSKTDSTTSSKTEESKTEESKTEESKEEQKEAGKVLNIYAWNEEFKGFFEKYYQGTEKYTDADATRSSTTRLPVLKHLRVLQLTGSSTPLTVVFTSRSLTQLSRLSPVLQLMTRLTSSSLKLTTS